MRKLWPFLGIAIAVAIGVAVGPYLLGVVALTAVGAGVLVIMLWRLVLTVLAIGFVYGLVGHFAGKGWTWLLERGYDAPTWVDIRAGQESQRQASSQDLPPDEHR